MDRQVLVDDQRERIGANVADRSEILERVVTHLLDRRHDRHHRQCGKEQGVAVRRRLSDKIGGDSPARARFILDDERAAKSLAETLRCHAREAVGVAAGGKRHNDRHRPLRPVGLCRYRGCCEKSANRDTKDGTENWQNLVANAFHAPLDNPGLTHSDNLRHAFIVVMNLIELAASQRLEWTVRRMNSVRSSASLTFSFQSISFILL